MAITEERYKNIITELIEELGCGADEEYLAEILDQVFTQEEREYLNV